MSILVGLLLVGAPSDLEHFLWMLSVEELMAVIAPEVAAADLLEAKIIKLPLEAREFLVAEVFGKNQLTHFRGTLYLELGPAVAPRYNVRDALFAEHVPQLGEEGILLEVRGQLVHHAGASDCGPHSAPCSDYLLEC